MEYVRAARMLGGSARSFARELAPLVADLAEALLDVVLVSLRLAAALARPLLAAALSLRRALAPPAAVAAAALWRVFVRQSPEALALEAAGGCAVVAAGALEARFGVVRGVWRVVERALRAVASWYRRVRRGVRDKSRLAGVLLSHVVFAVPVVVGCVWARGAVGVFVRKYGLLLVSCALPGGKTVRALYRMEDDGDEPTPGGGAARTSRRGADVDGGDSSDGGGGGSGEEWDDKNSRDAGAAAAERTPPLERAGGENRPAGVVRRRRRATSRAATSPTAITPPRTRAVVAAKRATPTQTPAPAARARRSAKSVERASREKEAELLHFWAVFGVAWAVRAVARFFTPALFEPLVDRLDTFLFFFAVWLQLGLTRGADVLFPLLASALRQGHHLRANASAGAEQLNVFLRVLVSVGAVRAERAALIGSTLTESGVALVGLIFFVTPRSATFVGTLLTGCAVPVYLSVYAATPASLSVTRHTWLSYWTAYAAVEAVYSYASARFDWVPLWYHCKLALILWLQVPYYRGASTLLDSGVAHYGSIVSLCRRRPSAPPRRRIA
jgi:hypothetical protein